MSGSDCNRVFLIADTRSGSTALSDGLAAALRVSSEGEIFYSLEPDRGPHYEISYVLKELDRLEAVPGFVAKVMYHDLLIGHPGRFRIGGLPHVLAQISQRFPSALLLHLTRRDFVAAAYSELLANQTKVFHIRRNAAFGEKRREVLSAEQMAEARKQARGRQASYLIASEYIGLMGMKRSVTIDYSDLVGGTAVKALAGLLPDLEKLELPYKKIGDPEEIEVVRSG